MASSQTKTNVLILAGLGGLAALAILMGAGGEPVPGGDGDGDGEGDGDGDGEGDGDGDGDGDNGGGDGDGGANGGDGGNWWDESSKVNGKWPIPPGYPRYDIPGPGVRSEIPLLIKSQDGVRRLMWLLRYGVTPKIGSNGGTKITAAQANQFARDYNAVRRAIARGIFADPSNIMTGGIPASVAGGDWTVITGMVDAYDFAARTSGVAGLFEWGLPYIRDFISGVDYDVDALNNTHLNTARAEVGDRWQFMVNTAREAGLSN